VGIVSRLENYPFSSALQYGRPSAACEQVSWAAGIGVKKSPFKNLFEEDHGVTYIPWAKIPTNLASVAEGGSVDEDSLPQPTPATGELEPILLCF